MFTNMVAQLREANALDRLSEVYAELPRTRRELGYPPLVTPTSQIVGTQAIGNVLFGRYKVISEQVKDYVYGLYGKPPAPIEPEVQKVILKGYERGEQPITGRAADILEPELDKAAQATKDVANDIGDVLIYALYPTTGMRFLRWKYGLEEPPPETKAKTLEDVKREDELIARVKSGELFEKVEAPAEIEEEAKAVVVEEEAVAGTPLLTPMPGTIIRYLVEEGDKVKAGDGIVVLEAMKMENVLPAPEDGKIKAMNFKPGDKVNTNDVLAIIV
jgi:pyruvate carboxylase subunit B